MDDAILILKTLMLVIFQKFVKVIIKIIVGSIMVMDGVLFLITKKPK